MGPDRTGPDRTGPDRSGAERSGPDRITDRFTDKKIQKTKSFTDRFHCHAERKINK